MFQFSPQRQYQIPSLYHSGLVSPQYMHPNCVPRGRVSLSPHRVVNQNVYPQVLAQSVSSSPYRTSRMEYVPYQKKIIEYEEQEIISYVPRERKIKDYYAVQYATEYIPQTFVEKQIEYVPVERTQQRVQYQTIQKQYIRPPQQQQLQTSQFRHQYYQAPPLQIQSPVARQNIVQSRAFQPLLPQTQQAFNFSSIGQQQNVISPGIRPYIPPQFYQSQPQQQQSQPQTQSQQPEQQQSQQPQQPQQQPQQIQQQPQQPQQPQQQPQQQLQQQPSQPYQQLQQLPQLYPQYLPQQFVPPQYGRPSSFYPPQPFQNTQQLYQNAPRQYTDQKGEPIIPPTIGGVRQQKLN